MMKLNQLIALVCGKKSRVKEATTKAYHTLQAAELFDGMNRTYRPRDDDGETLPDETKKIQQHADSVVRTACGEWGDLLDLVITQDEQNRLADGEIKLDGQVIVPKVPVTTLLYLEKALTDIRTLVSAVPTLDPSEEWDFSESTGYYETGSRGSIKTKKVFKNHVAYEATKEHPAQVQTYTEDVQVGTWVARKFSSRWTEAKKSSALNKIQHLLDAVKTAREDANCLEFLGTRVVSAAIFDYLKI
jgi:hypothetical protein